MSSIGKKILSAFVEVTGEDKPVIVKPADNQASSTTNVRGSKDAETNNKFKQYFHNLFSQANLPGPDYYEFSKMVEAMNAIPDEKARLSAAFAGLSVQGLDKEKLLSTAGQYLKILEEDETNFNSTIDLALQEKVHTRKKEMEKNNNRIKELSQEIADLQSKITVLDTEIKENEQKILSSTSGYNAEAERLKNKILSDIEKINKHLQ